MKRILLTGFFLACMVNSYSFSNLHGNDPQASQIFVPLPGIDTKICLTDYVKLNAHKYKELTGRKLKWKEANVLKSTQRQIKKIIHKDGSIDILAYNNLPKESFKFHWGGFLLGLLVPIGFIITLFFKDKNKRNRTNSALYGMLLVLAIGVTVLVLALLAGAV